MEIYGGYAKSGRKHSPEDIAGLLNGAFRLGRDSDGFRMSRDFLGRMLADKAFERAGEHAVNEFFATLRRLVDDWIDSGKNRDGVDSPLERVVPVEKLSKFLKRNPPATLMYGPVPTRLGLFIGPCLSQPHPLVRARDLAIFMFMQLVDSPGQERFSRCDGCERYFVHARMPKRNAFIKHGSFCGQCKGKGGARRTAARRQQMKKRMLALAVDFWAMWEPRHGKRSEFVARKMNLKGEQSVTPKWVTQNRQTIEANADRRKHATRQKERS